jgi:hypothetical protein
MGRRATAARYRVIEPGASKPSTLLQTVWVITMADEPRPFPNFNHVIVATLMLSYINSLAVGLAFNLGAFGDLPLLIQPKKSVGGHGVRALPLLILLIPLPGFLGMTKTPAELIHFLLDATISLGQRTVLLYVMTTRRQGGYRYGRHPLNRRNGSAGCVHQAHPLRSTDLRGGPFLLRHRAGFEQQMAGDDAASMQSLW